jgi:RNA polymerase sigma-70 factor (sigma-E family)
METLGATTADDVGSVAVVRDPVLDSAFAEFYAATWQRMYRTAYAVARDAGAAEDALQSAYARAFASWRRVSRADVPEAYLRRMVVNEVLGARRWAARRPERLTDAPEHLEVTPVTSEEQQLADRDALWAALERLAPRQRAVLVLRYYEDLSEAEIADALGCSRGTVKSQAADALAHLRRMTGLTDGSES